MKYGIDTRCQHLADDNKDEIYGAISYPIYQSATFARDRVGGGSVVINLGVGTIWSGWRR